MKTNIPACPHCGSGGTIEVKINGAKAIKSMKTELKELAKNIVAQKLTERFSIVPDE